jgi:hypothetical protein
MKTLLELVAVLACFGCIAIVLWDFGLNERQPTLISVAELAKELYPLAECSALPSRPPSKENLALAATAHQRAARLPID